MLRLQMKTVVLSQSLDHQGINFKAIDTRAMRPKSLVNEIEIVFDEVGCPKHSFLFLCFLCDGSCFPSITEAGTTGRGCLSIGTAS